MIEPINILKNTALLESEFHSLADRWLLATQDRLEDADEDGLLDADYAPGVLTIQLDNGQVYVVSKHAPSKQIWLSSPISGGLHFSYDDDSSQWILADGRSIADILSGELHTLTGICVQL